MGRDSPFVRELTKKAPARRLCGATRETDGMHRLPQIVARDGEKPRFGKIRLLKIPGWIFDLSFKRRV
jgi:hypothetical protein